MYVPVPAYQSLDQILTTYLGAFTQDQWDAVIAANHLDWPYLVEGDEPTAFTASGTVAITWTGPVPTTIPAGTVVEAPVAGSAAVRQYTTQADLTFVANTTQSVAVVATLPGSFYNAPPNSVTTVVGYPAAQVSNPAPITGGMTLRVLKPGDFLWIPDQFLPTQTPVDPPKLLRFAEAQGETDVRTTPTGGLLWGENDLQLVQGAATLLQDAAHRLRTPLGRLSWAPTVGSLIHTVVAQPAPTALQRLQALSVATVGQDPRLQNVKVAVTPAADDPTTVFVTLTAQTAPTPYQIPIRIGA